MFFATASSLCPTYDNTDAVALVRAGSARLGRGCAAATELYGRVFDRMYESLNRLGLTQEPELRVIRAAGHQSEGDFFFVSK